MVPVPTPPPPPTAVWLLPSTDDALRLTAIIDDLAARHGSPRFEPHLTVLGGLRLDPARTQAVMRRIADRTAPMELAIRGVRHSPVFFESVFLRIEDDRRLQALRGQLCVDLGHRPHRAPAPHVSLVYGELPEDLRRSLRATIDAGRGLLFDRIALATPGDDALDWLDVSQWRVLAISELAVHEPRTRPRPRQPF